ncbi:hypothetical protein NDU88_006482 [Pleurodeles waltl]|uniref:Uncharacterized protein n=1 Tax=Pleurodeles waltl TaxID=8319 RepID=A0AAV7SPN4_PLEWA|nr:hypothetical protein NDU88_006482 [Pleurodeles waltl]
MGRRSLVLRAGARCSWEPKAAGTEGLLSVKSTPPIVVPKDTFEGFAWVFDTNLGMSDPKKQELVIHM